MKNKKLEKMQRNLILHSVRNQGSGTAWTIDPESGFGIKNPKGLEAFDFGVIIEDHESAKAAMAVEKILQEKELVTIVQDQFHWDQGGASVYIFLATNKEYQRIWDKVDQATGSFEKHRAITEYVWETARERPEEWTIICSGPY